MIGNNLHSDAKLFIKYLFTIVVNGKFIVNIPFMQEIAVLYVWTFIFFQKIRAVFSCAV